MAEARFGRLFSALATNGPFSSRSFRFILTHQDLRCNLCNTNAIVFLISFRCIYDFSVLRKSKTNSKNYGLINNQLAPRIKQKTGENTKATAKINFVSFLPMKNYILHLWKHGSRDATHLEKSYDNPQKYIYIYNCLFLLGVAGGAVYNVQGGGTNYQCLPRDPQWGQHTNGLKSLAYIHGAEYEMRPTNSPFLKVSSFANVLRYSCMLGLGRANKNHNYILCNWNVWCVFTQMWH